MRIDRSKPVLVTGGNGYIASWIVRYLLEEGLQVHATVRDPSKQAKVGHLQTLADAFPGKLQLFAADLLQPGAFDAAMQGCELVMHTASPFVVKGISDPAEQLVKPAVEGTRNVLEAAGRIASVKRVVLTSSVAAIYGDAADIELIDGPAFTEAHWNTTSSVDHQPYSYSKLAAERCAWEIATAQSRWDLVTINPSLVMGPSLTQGSDSTSLSTIRELADGTLASGVPDMHFGMVDVRDVARAHLKAGFKPEAQGRHITSAGSMSLMQMARTLRQHFGAGYRFPKMVAPKFLVWLIAPLQGYSRKFIARNVGYRLQFDNRHTCRALDMEFRDPAQTLIEHFQQMIDDGIVPAPR